MFSIVIVPIVAIAAVVVLVVLYRSEIANGASYLKQVGILFVLLGVTIVLLLFYVPRRIAFAVSRSSLKSC